MNEVERRRRIQALGQRALDYYEDTGLCVFCDADDLTGTPHEDCDVGELFGRAVTPERIAEKARQRGLVNALIKHDLAREIDEAAKEIEGDKDG